MSRNEAFLQAVDVLQSGRSLELIGEHGSGRTHLLQRVREYFVTLGWNVIEVTGIEAFRRVNLSALAMAGFTDTADGRTGALVGAYRALADQVRNMRTVIIVDDSDCLDEASWGVIGAVSTQLTVPVATSRLRHRQPHAPVHPTSGFSVVYALELQPMGYAELESALEVLSDVKIESGTMSRIFAKSGGNVGIAGAILDAARRAGNIVVENRIARATASLWTPALRSIAEVILQPLETETIVSLKTLALLGPADYMTALKVVPEPDIILLEELAFLTVVEVGESKVVTVSPPILVEHFRHDSMPAQRAALLARIDGSLADDASLEVAESAGPHDTAMYVRLVHEQTRRATLQAREAWQNKASVENATTLLLALEADLAHSSEEVAALIATVRTVAATDHARADWELAHAEYLANHRGEWQSAVAALRKIAGELPGEGPRLLGRAAFIEMSFGPIPAEEPFPEVDVEALRDDIRPHILLAKVFWRLTRGQVTEAEQLLNEHQEWASADLRLGALIVYCQLALGKYRTASLIADVHLRDARENLDSSRIRVYSFLSSGAALFSRGIADAENAIGGAESLGTPAGEAPLSFVGVTLLGAYFAVKRGQRTLMSQYLAELDAAEIPDGPLPGMQRSFVHARLALLDGNTAGAARIQRDAGDELWERGAYLAAAFVYLDGVRLGCSRDDWTHAEARIAMIDSPGFRSMAHYVRALVDQDTKALVDIIERIDGSGENVEANRLARSTLAALTDLDPTDESIAALRAFEQRGRGEGVITAGVGELTAREREVAKLVASGLSNPMIAEALVVSVRTVESHVNKLIKKIGGTRRQDIRDYLIATGVRL